MRYATRWLRAVLLLTALVPLLLGSKGFRNDELDCEEAVSHALGCCPDLQPGAVSCVFTDGCDTDTNTDLSMPESRCIQELDCDQIQGRHLCEVLQKLHDPVLPSTSSGAPLRPVCP